jgi:hypothetical protein
VALTGETSDAAIVITALIIAGVLTPIRKALEGAIERRFNPKTSAGGSGRQVTDDSLTEERLSVIERRLAALERERQRP